MFAGTFVGKLRAKYGQKTGDLQCVRGAFTARKTREFRAYSSIKRVYLGSICEVKWRESGILQDVLKTD